MLCWKQGVIALFYKILFIGLGLKNPFGSRLERVFLFGFAQK